MPPVTPAEWVPPGLAVSDIGIAETLLGTRDVLSRIIVLRDQPMALTPWEAIVPGLTFRPPDSQADVSPSAATPS